MLCRGLGQLFGVELVEDLDHIDAFHHQLTVVKDAAVDIAAVLQLQVAAGREGQRGNGTHRQADLQRLAVEHAGEADAVSPDSQRALACGNKFGFIRAQGVDLGFGGDGKVGIVAQAVLQIVEDLAAPIGHIAKLRALAIVVEEAEFVAMLAVTAGGAGQRLAVAGCDGEFLAAMGAAVEHILQALHAASVAITLGIALLLPVGIKQQRVAGGLADVIHAHLGQVFLVKQLVNIDAGLAGAHTFGPFRHDKIAAVGTGHIHIHAQPLEEFVGSAGNGRGKPVLAHKAGRIDDQRLAVIDDGFHVFHIHHGGLELLLGNHAHFVQETTDGQGIIERIADDKGHGPGCGSDEIDKIISALVVGDDHKGAGNALDLIAQHFISENQLRYDPANRLGDAVVELARLTVMHNCPPCSWIVQLYHRRPKNGIKKPLNNRYIFVIFS